MCNLIPLNLCYTRSVPRHIYSSLNFAMYPAVTGDGRRGWVSGAEIDRQGILHRPKDAWFKVSDNTFCFCLGRRLLCLFSPFLSFSIYLSIYLSPPFLFFFTFMCYISLHSCFFFTFIIHVRCTLSISTGQRPVSLSAVNSLHVQ